MKGIKKIFIKLSKVPMKKHLKKAENKFGIVSIIKKTRSNFLAFMIGDQASKKLTFAYMDCLR